MKFTVDIEEFWLEEEELASTLQNHIKDEVVHKILQSIKEKVERQITIKINDVINQKVELIIDRTLSELTANEIIIVNGSEVSIRDNIKNIFQRNHGWNNPATQLKRIAETFGEELKLQYNNAFANKIVCTMKEQGFLKDEIVQILLKGKEE